MPGPEVPFASNDISIIYAPGVDHYAYRGALKKALYNFMHGIGLAEDVREWFDGEVPRTRVPRTFVARALKA